MRTISLITSILPVETTDGMAIQRTLDANPLTLTTSTQKAKASARTMCKAERVYSFVQDGVTLFGTLPAHVVFVRPTPRCQAERDAQDAVAGEVIAMAAAGLLSPSTNTGTSPANALVGPVNLARVEAGFAPVLPPSNGPAQLSLSLGFYLDEYT